MSTLLNFQMRATRDDMDRFRALRKIYGSYAEGLRALLREDAKARLRLAEVRRDTAAIRRDANVAVRETVQIREHGKTVRLRSRQDHQATMEARREACEAIERMEADARRRVANGEDPVVVYAELAARVANLMKGF